MSRFSTGNFKIEQSTLISPNINIDLTEDCNLRCSYCYIKKNHSNKILPETMGQELIDFWLANSVPINNKKRELSFWGGETLLEWELLKKLALYARKKISDLVVFTVSNGVLYTPEKVDWCKENNVYIAVTFDGIKNTHDKHRGFSNGSGSWEIINKNLEYAGKANPNQVILSTLTPDAAPDLLESIKYCVDHLGITYIMHVPVLDVEWKTEDFAVLQTQIKKALKYTRNHHKKITLSSFDKKIKKSDIGPCRAGNLITTFSVDGVCFPCHRFNKYNLTYSKKKNLDYALGYFNNGIYTPLGNKKKEFTHFNKKQKDECKGCEIYRTTLCNGGCFYINYKMTNNIHGVHKTQCEYRKTIYRAKQ